MGNHRDHRRGNHPPWPHFDRKGPEYYYQQERQDHPPPYRDIDGPPRAWNRDQGDSQLYRREADVDRFYPEENRYRSYSGPNDHWPEDDFYYTRRDLWPEEDFIERGVHYLRNLWRELHGQEPYHGHFPEDRPQGYDGRDTQADNRNRGSHGRYRHNRY